MKKVETWLDRITNESNLWLNAMQAEDEGNYLQAFFSYLRDARECLRESSFVRAALSCSCAAECLVLTGKLAATRQLNLQTATFYEKNAEQVIGHSVREALWSYQQAYEYYNLAYEANKARDIYERYVSLSRKVNPFSGEKEAMESLRWRKTETEDGSIAHQTEMEISAHIDSAIKHFLSETRPKNEREEESIIQGIFNKITTERT